MINNKYISSAVLASLLLAAPVFANTGISTSISAGLHADVDEKDQIDLIGMHPAGITGTVTAVNGTTLTVTSNNRLGWVWTWGRYHRDGDEEKPKTTPTPITYTVDASHATVIKAGAASTVANIAANDKVVIKGTVTGTNVVASAIRDNEPKPTKTPKPTPTPVIQGNGQPVIAGSVSAISGTTLTITNESNVTYTVDASNAKIQNKGALSTLSTVAVGDKVVVQGAVNGTSVNAYSVIDLGTKASVKTDGKLTAHFRGIGLFFRHLFGF